MPQSVVTRALWALLTATYTLQIGQAQLQCPTGKCSITVDQLFDTDASLRNTAVLRAVFSATEQPILHRLARRVKVLALPGWQQHTIAAARPVSDPARTTWYRFPTRLRRHIWS